MTTTSTSTSICPGDARTTMIISKEGTECLEDFVTRLDKLFSSIVTQTPQISNASHHELQKRLQSRGSMIVERDVIILDYRENLRRLGVENLQCFHPFGNIYQLKLWPVSELSDVRFLNLQLNKATSIIEDHEDLIRAPRARRQKRKRTRR